MLVGELEEMLECLPADAKIGFQNMDGWYTDVRLKSVFCEKCDTHHYLLDLQQFVERDKGREYE